MWGLTFACGETQLLRADAVDEMERVNVRCACPKMLIYFVASLLVKTWDETVL